jgi:hypothetical protein
VGKGSQNIVEELSGSRVTEYDDVHTESQNCIQYTESLISRVKSNLKGIHF